MTNEELLNALIEIVAPNGEPPMDGALAMRRDAYRWRWMRGNVAFSAGLHVYKHGTDQTLSQYLQGEEADKAVDESMLRFFGRNEDLPPDAASGSPQERP